MVGAVCGEYPLVPRFEGEEDDGCESMDLPVAKYPSTPVGFPTVRMVDRAPKLMFKCIAEVPPSFVSPLVGFTKFSKVLKVVTTPVLSSPSVLVVWNRFQWLEIT